jgi:hypothetical protein
MQQQQQQWSSGGNIRPTLHPKPSAHTYTIRVPPPHEESGQPLLTVEAEELHRVCCQQLSCLRHGDAQAPSKVVVPLSRRQQ